MKFRLLPSAETLDRAANRVYGVADNRLGDAITNTFLAPLRRLHDDACTCGEADCPGKD